MGYDISLVDFDGYPVKVERHSEGGYMIVGGNTDATISITYNYSKYFYETIDGKEGIRWLYDRPAHECYHTLRAAIKVLGTYRDEDYWESTPGNAGYILSILLKWADQYPNTRFIGD